MHSTVILNSSLQHNMSSTNCLCMMCFKGTVRLLGVKRKRASVTIKYPKEVGSDYFFGFGYSHS